MTWEQHRALCTTGDLPALLAHLETETRPAEREVFYISTFNMMWRNDPGDAIEIGRLYIDEFSREPRTILPASKPSAEVLAQLSHLYEADEAYDFAAWVCEVALHFGITNDGTKKGFAARLARLRQQGSQPAA